MGLISVWDVSVRTSGGNVRDPGQVRGIGFGGGADDAARSPAGW